MINSVVSIIKQNNKILFLKRHSYDRTLPNVLCLPGGKVDGDGSLDIALLREVFEETQMTVTNSILIGDSVFSPKPEKVFKMYFYLCEVSEFNVILSDEHEFYKWVDIYDIDLENIGKVTKEFLLNNLNLIK